MENKVYKEDSEGKAFDRWWRWVEYERGRVFQYDDINNPSSMIAI